MMPDYRLYRLDESDRIVEALAFNAPDDAAAIAEAVRVDHAAAIEIWCGPRKVGRVDPGGGSQ